MKILIVSHEYPPVGGGGANACMHLAQNYVDMGHNVAIITAWFQGQKETEAKGDLLIYRVCSARKRVEQCSFVEMMDFLIKAGRLAKNLEESQRFDLCQIFFGIPSGPVGYYLKGKYGLPYVIRFGGGDIPGFQERFTLVYRLIAPFIKMIWKRADALVANSCGLKKMAESFYDKREILIIPNGAEVATFSDDQQVLCREDKGQIRLLFVSRLIERKGLQDFLPLLNSVADECKEKGKQIVFDIVGDGPYRPILEEIVSQNGLETMVKFHGQKDKSELPRFYEQADIFVFPSRKEGMPNVVLEAMSYALPIIMTPCEGSQELISDNGYICNVQDFPKRIGLLASDYKKRCELGANSYRLVRDRFSWENTAKQYNELFKAIV